jgi:hypothetical protein
LKYEYLGLEKTARIGGKKYHFVPGEVYEFKDNPGSTFRKVAKPKTAKVDKEIDHGTDS